MADGCYVVQVKTCYSESNHFQRDCSTRCTDVNSWLREGTLARDAAVAVGTPRRGLKPPPTAHEKRCARKYECLRKRVSKDVWIPIEAPLPRMGYVVQVKTCYSESNHF